MKAHAVERDARNLLHHTQTLTGEVREIIAGTRDLALDSAGLATQIAKDAAMFGVGTATSAVSATTGLTMHVANEIYKRTAEPFVRHLTQGMDSTNVTDNLVAAKVCILRGCLVCDMKLTRSARNKLCWTRSVDSRLPSVVLLSWAIRQRKLGVPQKIPCTTLLPLLPKR